VAQPGETLGERIAEHQHQHDGRELQAQGTQPGRSRQEKCRARHGQARGSRQRNLAGGQLAARGARVGRVDAAIDDAVEAHGCGARADHGKDNGCDLRHGHSVPARREGDSSQGKGQGEKPCG